MSSPAHARSAHRPLGFWSLRAKKVMGLTRRNELRARRSGAQAGSGYSDSGQAGLVQASPDAGLEVRGDRGRLEADIHVPSREREKARPEVAVPDPEMIKAPAIQHAPPLQEGQHGRIHQPFLVAVRLRGAGGLDAWPLVQGEIVSP